MAAPPTPAVPKTQLPDWEIPANGATAHKPGLSAKLRALLPAPAHNHHQRYSCTNLRTNRRAQLLLGAGALLVLVGLVVGLAVGLTVGRNSRHAQNLPLPTSSTPHTGDLTYYGPGLGACGIDSSDKDLIVSISQQVFDAAGANAGVGGNPNANPLCNRKIRARRYHEGLHANRSVDLTVVDRCVGCAATDIDVSPGAFDELAPRESGRVAVVWAWLGAGAGAGE
ncbi:uncharacterized protein K452DRAFT_284630 [Aplosporella prunicola CBS 121167]|uniref:RlpA-like protein double-psi beta-barrel domain-containing protein n=1 Tax=Aplosporella prunicola CBS 121167 TaxID=1176127 RepID=A0A6A6BP66_9PEZI|nr:uncharacterized protein K452DRAFT_284630 [Aplosporella prunicola CBS 121167]KAF2145233.1 hypothetical protein K452DRAFT_284630 [Aplosporella prunicola CBS 121167]